MQLRKRDKIKKNIDVVINKDKNIIWNIDFTDDSEYYAKTPETLYESIEFYINKYEEYIKNKSPGSASEANPIGVKQLKKLAKKIIKVKKIKLGEIAQKVEISKNNLKLWFKNKLTEVNEISQIDTSMKIWVLMEMNTLKPKDLHALILKYFKQEDTDPTVPALDSQDLILKNLLSTFFPKNKQMNNKSVHSTKKLNGILLFNKPPGIANHLTNSHNFDELIPIEINVIFEEISFAEVILWDSLKKETSEILTFSYLYLQDLMKENDKVNIDKKTLEGLSLKLAKEIISKIEEYDTIMKNSDILANFQLSSNVSSNDNIIFINLKINDEDFQYNDSFEWGLTNNTLNVEIFINNLCEDLKFPEKIKRELIIQMKQQIFESLKLRLKKMMNTFQNILPSDNFQDISLEDSEKLEEESLYKKPLPEKKRLNLRKVSGTHTDDFKDLKQELTHTLTETMPMIPESYEPFEDTFYLQKNELYQFLEKNPNHLTANKKKILDTHSSFYKGFVSLVQHSRTQSQRVPSENRVLNYKNLDKTLPERPQTQILNGIAKPGYFTTPSPSSQINMNKIAEENENEKNNRNLKTQNFNSFIHMPPPPDYSMQNYSYPYRKDNNFNGMQNFNKPIPSQNYQNQQIMTRSFQTQAQYNQYLALTNNYKPNSHTFQEPPNPNVFGNQLKITHTLNPPHLYNFHSNYAKYPQNLYLGNASAIRINKNNLQNDQNNFTGENIVKFNEEQSYKNFGYLGDHMAKKMNTSYYPTTDHSYYKNPEINRESTEYMNGFANNEATRHNLNMIGNSEDMNEFPAFEKKAENKVDAMNADDNYLIGDNDEFKIKRINSLTKFNGQKQIEDFLANNQNNQENRINFND